MGNYCWDVKYKRDWRKDKSHPIQPGCEAQIRNKDWNPKMALLVLERERSALQPVSSAVQGLSKFAFCNKIQDFGKYDMAFSGKTLTQRDRFKNSNELYADARSEGTGTLEEPVEVALTSLFILRFPLAFLTRLQIWSITLPTPHIHTQNLKLFPRWASWCSAGPSSDKGWLSFSHMLDSSPWLVHHHCHLFQLTHFDNCCHHIPS